MTTTDRPFRVNTKKARSAAAKAECAEELGALFSCMMGNKYDVDVACAGHRRALDACVAAASARVRSRNTINYHLQRLSRALKR